MTATIPDTLPRCRVSGAPLSHVFVDLGMSPLANSYVDHARLNDFEPFFPLKVYVSPESWLVQLPPATRPEAIFSDYAYFSSYSTSWLEHCKTYAEFATRAFGLGPDSRVIELASNDGYLLQYFARNGIPVLGVEPAANVAQVAIDKGLDTIVEFFGVECAQRLAEKGLQADLIVANNVLAHVPDILDFARGVQIALKPNGRATFEFPHLLKLIELNQYDTIYHEHYSYLSLLAAEILFAKVGLRVFDVEQLSTHGGSLRVYAARIDSDHRETDRLAAVRSLEASAGLNTLAAYTGFAEKAMRSKREILKFLIRSKEEGRTVAGYGAPAKGNTLLNYCGIREDLLPFTVDLSAAKQGKRLPGSRIPIYSPEKLLEFKPDYVWILPWNLKNEIADQMSQIKDWGGKFMTAIPDIEVF